VRSYINPRSVNFARERERERERKREREREREREIAMAPKGLNGAFHRVKQLGNWARAKLSS